MASLYQLGLINGFYGGISDNADPLKVCAPPDVAMNLLRIDLTSESAMDALYNANKSLLNRLRAGVEPNADSRVRVVARSRTWTEVKRGGGPGSTVEPAWFAVHTVSHSVTHMHATLWCEHPHLHCVFALASAEVQAPAEEEGIVDWGAVDGTFNFYSADLDRAKQVVRDDLRDELVYMARIAFILQMLDEYDMLVATRSTMPRLTFSDQRRISRRIDPGVRKRLLRDTVVSEIDVRLSETRAATVAEEAVRANEWVEFDPLAERRAAGTRPYTPRRQHEVGGFTRFMKKSGKTVPVRAHVRGNPLLGVVKRMKNVITEP